MERLIDAPEKRAEQEYLKDCYARYLLTKQTLEQRREWLSKKPEVVQAMWKQRLERVWRELKSASTYG